MTQERTFLTHPEGTGEIYNLQVVEESELPGFFSQFKLDTDDSWKDVARRWLFYNATVLEQEQVQEIVETHNEDRERILEHGEFNRYSQVVYPARVLEDGSSNTLPLDENNELYGYGVFNVHANCFVDLPDELSSRPSTPDHVTTENPADLLQQVAHDHGLDNTKHLRIVEVRLANHQDKSAEERVPQ